MIRRFDLKTQAVEVSKKLPETIFGEGITPFGEDKIIQLSWKKGLGIVFDRESINILETFRYKTEGWGITAKGDRLVMSDGSAKLFFLNPESYEVLSELTVTKDGKEITRLNELEWVDQYIYANVWQTNEIVQIDPESGFVTASIDCSNLEKKRPQSSDAVLNGIAYDQSEKVFYLTGKTWKNMYKVKFSSN